VLPGAPYGMALWQTGGGQSATLPCHDGFGLS